MLDTVDKYAELLSNKDFKRPAAKSAYQKTWEFFLGASDEPSPFEQKLHRENQFNSHRLGAKWDFQKKKDGKRLFEGKYILSGKNGFWNGHGIIDTATDLSMIKGACKDCDFT
jgi:hypothetical protein